MAWSIESFRPARPLFDAYIVVDWSASGVPRTGRDSIWIGVVERHQGRLLGRVPENLPTRVVAAARLFSLLRARIGAEQNVLVGFDFPLGYPSDLANRLGLGRPPWLAVWDELARLIRDTPTNANNRYAIAADLNRRISGSPSPFWGCPQSARSHFLSPCRWRGRGASTLPERRLADLRVPRAQPGWKLAYPGSAGGQALVGIPIVRRLRRRLARAAHVWPFETGLRALPAGFGGHQIIFVEVYPSIIPIPVTAGHIKDALQVDALARHFARLDDSGGLAPLFAGPPDLTASERRRIETEEGWILGVT